MSWKLSNDLERSARLDRLTEADIITPEIFDNFLDRHSQPGGEKEDDRIVIPAPGEIFEIPVDKGVDEYRQNGRPWGYFNPEITSKNYPRKSQGARTIRCCFLRGVDLKPQQGVVYRDVAKQEFQAGTKRFPHADEAMAVIAKFKKLGIETASMVAFIEGSDCAFFVRRFGDDRILFCNSFEYWDDINLFLAVCE